MPPTLNEADGLAVDALLNRLSDLHAELAACDDERKATVERLLNLLDSLVVGDVPQDLLGRTLRRIRRATQEQSSIGDSFGHQPAI